MTTRHFTATGFVVHQSKVLLHWHPKVKAWLPPGGHIDDNEDPVQAVLREIVEESGVHAEVVPTGDEISLDYPTQVHAPFTIMVEDIDDPVAGFHQHIDMIYFCQPTQIPDSLNDGWLWIGRDHLANGNPIEAHGAPEIPPPTDVKLLAERAFEVIEDGARPSR